MKNLSLLVAIGLIGSFSTPSFAQENSSLRAKSKGAYVTAGVGGGWASSPSGTYVDSGTVMGYPYSGTWTGPLNLGGGVAVDAGFGYDFGNSLRGELTYVLGSYAVGSGPFSGNVRAAGQNFASNGTISGTGNLTTNSVMVSGYYDFKSKSRFTPYIGAGIGYTSVSVPTLLASDSVGGTTQNSTEAAGRGSAFGYQAKVGVSYAVSRPADIFAEAIYQGNTAFSYYDHSFGALNAFSARAGARYRFGN
jgi:opacity protein-like surface antigen